MDKIESSLVQYIILLVKSLCRGRFLVAVYGAFRDVLLYYVEMYLLVWAVR